MTLYNPMAPMNLSRQLLYINMLLETGRRQA